MCPSGKVTCIGGIKICRNSGRKHGGVVEGNVVVNFLGGCGSDYVGMNSGGCGILVLGGVTQTVAASSTSENWHSI